MKIDFVILWVDGSDPKWIKDKEKYVEKSVNGSESDNRFRDWDNLKYWFRGVEKYAPWVNKIHFITYGHLPEWLNLNNEKLDIVRHEDIIDKEYLPTFNSNVIELNMHKIKGLEEHFVAFNDDMFICSKMEEKDFFSNEGLPMDECVQNVIISYGNKDQIAHACLNNIDIINRNFSKRAVMKENMFKFINVKYGVRNFRTLFLLPWYAFTGFYNPHLPVAHLKSTFNNVFNVEGEYIERMFKNKFRKSDDISHWVMRYWNLCSGNFCPRKSNIGKYFDASDDNTDICKAIESEKVKLLCINDSSTNYDFDKAKIEINGAFENLFPEKSTFEI